MEELEAALTERVVTVPVRLLLDDYTGIAGGHGSAAEDPACDLQNRLFATAWIGPWGSILPWSLPPSSVSPVPDGVRVLLRLPASRALHFLSDASLRLKKLTPGAIPKLKSATLRLGPDRILQRLDSAMACHVAWNYKSLLPSCEAVTFDTSDDSWDITSPLFFDLPLRVLPLFVQNMPPVEIEYEISGVTPENHIEFCTEVVSSVGEVETLSHNATVVQHLPSFLTFKSSEVAPGAAPQQVTIPVALSAEKLVRALYVRVFTQDREDIADCVLSIAVFGPQSQIGQTLAGATCRRRLKRRFTRTALPSGLPYYVVPFAVCPGGNVADYGVILSVGSRVEVRLTPQVEAVSVEVCAEFSERVVWKR